MFSQFRRSALPLCWVIQAWACAQDPAAPGDSGASADPSTGIEGQPTTCAAPPCGAQPSGAGAVAVGSGVSGVAGVGGPANAGRTGATGAAVPGAGQGLAGAAAGAADAADAADSSAAGQPAGSTDAQPPAAQGPAMPGAPGIGDEYFPEYGNGGYDVEHYEIRIRYSPSDDMLSGTTTITMTPTQHLSSFNLDFLLEVSDVSIDGAEASFAQESVHELVVTPAASLPAGQQVKVAVTYAGVPSSKRVQGLQLGTPWWHTQDGAVAAGAPENAWWWFPSNDHPSDKATYDIVVTVPDDVSAISNGVQVTPPMAAEPGWKTWSWKSSHPQQPYLTLLAIGKYEIVESMSEGGLPVTLAYSTRISAQTARAAVDRTAEIISWAESVYGPYPFEAIGGVVGPMDGINYAMEMQTRPIYPVSYFSGLGGRSTTSVVAHENGHQWFGDSVAVAHWRDVWLSEGFATYTEWLWSESQGEGTAQEIFDSAYARASSATWQVKIGDPGSSRVFDNAVYQRGAMTVHQLRVAVGDDKFFEILRTWQSTRRYGNGSIEDFIALSNMISGQDLEPLFTAWLYTASRPDLPTRPEPVTVPRSWESLMRTQAMHRPLVQPEPPGSR